MKKAIWCRGCSFTFGEGLQYFSELPSVNIPDEQYWDSKYLTNAQYQFIRYNRYSKLLADKLNTIDINGSLNGGTNATIYNALKQLLSPKYSNNTSPYLDEHYIELNEIGLIVIQFTDLFREHIKIDDILYEPASKYKDKFDWIETVSKTITFETFVEKVAEKTIKQFEILLKEIQEKNPDVIIRVFNWFPETDNAIRNNEYFKDKLLKFEIDGKTYNNFKDMIYGKHGLTIEETFYPKCGHDQHFNLIGQKLITDTIYASIKDEWEEKYK